MHFSNLGEEVLEPWQAPRRGTKDSPQHEVYIDSRLAQLNVDPIPALLAAKSESLRYFVRRELLGQLVPAVRTLRTPRMCCGSWEYPGGRPRPVP